MINCYIVKEKRVFECFKYLRFIDWFFNREYMFILGGNISNDLVEISRRSYINLWLEISSIFKLERVI